MTRKLAGFLLIDLGIAAIVVSVIVELSGSAALTLQVLGAASIVGGVVAVAITWYLYPRSSSDEELVKFGRPADATVIGVSDQGVTATGEQVARLRLQVMPANERPFTARREVTLPDVPAIGEQVRVKFNPHRRRRLIVLGDSSLRNGSPVDG